MRFDYSNLTLVFYLMAEWICASVSEGNGIRVQNAESRDYAHASYDVPGLAEGYRVTNVTLIKQHSTSSCKYGYSFGYTDSQIWVDKGCRGDFMAWTNKVADAVDSNSSPYTSSHSTPSSTLIPTQSTFVNIVSSVTEAASDTVLHHTRLSSTTVHAAPEETTDLQMKLASTLQSSSQSPTRAFVMQHTTFLDTRLTKVSSSFSSFSSVKSVISLKEDYSNNYLSITERSSSDFSPSPPMFQQSSQTKSDIHTSEFRSGPSLSRTLIPVTDVQSQSCEMKSEPSISLLSQTVNIHTQTTAHSQSLSSRLCCCNKISSRRDTAEKYMSITVTRLQVNVRNLSRSVRKKTSASDNRASSASIGIVGCLVIVTVILCIVLSDCMKIHTTSK